MIEKHIPVYNLLIPETTQDTKASEQGNCTMCEAEEMIIELNNGKHYAALVEAGDVMCSALKTMTTLIKENDFNCTVQDILDTIMIWR
jgi:hypothetical protein